MASSSSSSSSSSAIDVDMEVPSDIRVKTKVQSKKGSFYWAVEGFSLLNSAPNQHATSPKFDMCGIKNWQLRLFPGGCVDQVASNITCTGLVIDIPSFIERVAAKFKFSLLNRDGTVAYVMNDIEAKIHEPDSNYGPRGWIKRYYLLDPKCPALRSDGSMVFVVEAEVVTSIDHLPADDSLAELSIGQKNWIVPRMSTPDSLFACMSDLFQDGYLSDITLVVAGLSIPAHRCILRARSPVFKAMLAQQVMKEAKDGVVEIENASFEGVWTMVKFMYTDSVHYYTRVPSIDNKDAKAMNETAHKLQYNLQLLRLADRYQIAALFVATERYLSQKLTTEDVADILLEADMCNAAALKKACLAFLQAGKTHVSEMMVSEGYIERLSKKPELLALVLQAQVGPLPNPKKRKLDEKDMKAAGSQLEAATIKRMKVDDLKGELRKRGLPVSGMKEDLAKRLQIAVDKVATSVMSLDE